MLKKNYYDILKVPLRATQEEIMASYRLLFYQYCLDRYPYGSAEWQKANEKLEELKVAYDTLSDPQKRAAYDFQVKPSPTSGSAPRPPVLKDSSLELIYIPAGEFLRVSDRYYDERPSRRIYLDAYWIGKYPVTVAQYRQFCRATKRSMPDAPDWGWIDDHPMVKVTWDDAVAYADWVGGRLPTEAEWEKAARGTDGREYPWGNVWDPNKCHCSKKELGDAGRTAPVGSYPSGASPYGLHDMAGNVWEWCSDWYAEDYYTRSPSVNPENTQVSTDRFRVLRGSSWTFNNSDLFRCAYRHYFYPNSRDSFGGFRVARRA